MKAPQSCRLTALRVSRSQNRFAMLSPPSVPVLSRSRTYGPGLHDVTVRGADDVFYPPEEAEFVELGGNPGLDPDGRTVVIYPIEHLDLEAAQIQRRLA